MKCAEILHKKRLENIRVLVIQVIGEVTNQNLDSAKNKCEDILNFVTSQST